MSSFSSPSSSSPALARYALHSQGFSLIKLLTFSQPDWQKVVDELDLPSKGAASKRFSRLPGKYGIDPPNASSDNNAEGTPKKAKAPGSPKKKALSSPKKRKVTEANEDDDGANDAKVNAED